MAPAAPKPLEVDLYIPDAAPGRRVTLTLDGRKVADQTYSAPGSHTLRTEPLSVAGAQTTLEITIDRSFSPPGDRRELGMTLASVGFR